MSQVVVECVPNFSEGRDSAVLEAIAQAVRSVDGVTLLDVDPGAATHRTVFTFVGAPDDVVEAAFRAIRCARDRIDMRQHKGAHPRMGATDVCPFVPVRGITMEECAALAHRLGERVGAELGVPVYYYESAATRPERRNLAEVRAGEYEGLSARLADPAWAPDAGPAEWTEAVARSGATVIGARPFLIAYNINLNTANRKKAMKLAALVREKGIYRKDAHKQIIRDEHGVGIRDPGLFKGVKGIGWYIEEYGRCQVSLNITDHHLSPVHEVYDAVRRLADAEGVVVTGSELVGLIPLDALIAAGHHYLARQDANPGKPDRDLVELAIQSMGLRDLGPFNADERIIERRIGTDGPLVQMSVREFTDTLASDAPAPGGGSVAALCGALCAGLAAMVGQLTTGKTGYEAEFAASNEMAVRAQALRGAFLADIDADTAAFDAIMAAFGLPKASREDKIARSKAIQAATRHAIEVPLGVIERCDAALDCVEVALRGNRNARSDAGVAALCARACAEGAWYNVQINASSLKDADAAAAYRARADAAVGKVRSRTDAMHAAVAAELCGSQ